MMAIEDGGPAFPHAAYRGIEGMSLRDYFAGQSLAGLLAYSGPEASTSHFTFERAAADAYEYADAMLAKRHQAPAGVPSDPASAADR